MRFPLLWATLALNILPGAASPSAAAQSPARAGAKTGIQTSPTPPAYTLHTSSRIVLTDVTVTDRKGNPVHDLPASAFQIFDNKVPQHLASFKEHTGQSSEVAPAPALPAGVYSNDFLQHLPPVLNILVIDTTNLPLTDQMYLDEQLTKFVKNLAPGEALAIYDRSGTYSLMLQGFTSDHRLLLAALKTALPRFMPPGREYLSDLDLLHQIAFDLSQLPGRKNVIWFTGGSTLFLLGPDAAAYQDDAATHQVYDELEAGRIAIYPVDARGLTVHTSPYIWAQDGLLSDVAIASGGKAFYNTNGLGETAQKVLAVDRSFYTLTYSPSNFQYDNKWHKVKITLSDNERYTLSYRRGYFADGNSLQNPNSTQPRTHLLANGKTIQAPDARSSPIIFRASVVPVGTPDPGGESGFIQLTPDEPQRKGQTTFTIRYSIPADDFTMQPTDSGSQALVGLAIVAFDQYGNRSASRMNRLSIRLNPLSTDPRPPILRVKQQIDLAKHDTHLYLVVWDLVTGRLGTLQIPFEMPKDATKSVKR